ncbi:PTS sugar transporter subunit IIA [Halonatronum saccharophilum]|uniref:PTS sugar transporter subunit IIA n=1 Tax=Halonatronum saccharophilum TaxID=150060 RepID=UPI000483A710|nr:PTS sugar transporter subunit IIA [Halonatronum saccharophilum]
MNTTNILTLDMIELDLKSNNKKKVLWEMVGLLHKSGRIEDKEEFYEKVLAREEEGSTGMGRGVAIPHGKSSQVKELSLALGISRNGVDFDSLDGNPVHIFFMVADFEGHSREYLKLLGGLAHNIRQGEFREELLKADSKEEVLDIIKTSLS